MAIDIKGEKGGLGERILLMDTHTVGKIRSYCAKSVGKSNPRIAILRADGSREELPIMSEHVKVTDFGIEDGSTILVLGETVGPVPQVADTSHGLGLTYPMATGLISPK